MKFTQHENQPNGMIQRRRRLVGLSLRFLWLPLLAILTTSCALIRLKENVLKIESRGTVTIHVSNLSDSATNYGFATGQTSDGKLEMIGFQALDPDGFAVFLLLQNRTYAAGAFTDVNGNGKYDLGEPAQMTSNVRASPLADTSERARPIPLVLSVTNNLPPGITTRGNVPLLGETLAIALGQTADLDEPQFSAAVGEMAMWQPYEFLQQYRVGIYFLEPYDPKKIPVLFLYGIAGSPQDWRTVINHLDRKRYQPWVMLYASGFRLDKSASALSTMLLVLKQRHQFERLDIVAHSMGGLVARGAIQRAVTLANTNFIPHLVTISTPWQGHAAAESGVKHLSFPVPSWNDMVPGSDFLRSILHTPLPAGTRHDLIFSYKSSSEMGLSDENDGVVSLPSQLDLKVEEEAASVLGVYADHMGILSEPATLRRLEQCLSR